MVGAIGIVTLGIGGGDSLGEVELRIAGGTERYLAQAREAIDEGASVLDAAVDEIDADIANNKGYGHP